MLVKNDLSAIQYGVIEGKELIRYCLCELESHGFTAAGPFSSGFHCGEESRIVSHSSMSLDPWFSGKWADNKKNKNSLFKVEYILRNILSCKRISLYTEQFDLNKKMYIKLSKWLNRLKQKEPVQYITNTSYFMDFEFYVDKRVLIPRPETELLVHEIVNVYGNDSDNMIKGLDLGTGCGNISISILKYIKESFMFASDLSLRSLEVAKINAKKYDVSNKIMFIYSDIFSKIIEMNQKFDFIVSNPPYIPNSRINELPKEVSYEPKIALNGGEEGVDFYKNIILNCDRFLKTGGYVFLEIGDNQYCRVRRYIKDNTKLSFTKVIKDYNNKERIIVINKK